jgi:hypothetical protein
MIDEELYQQAADELNSDRRRAHIWARACALSKDDHDEARYLYTNLRVEELIAERDSGSPTSDDTSSLELNATVAMDSATDTTPKRVLPLDDTTDFDADSTLSLEGLSSPSDDSELKMELDDDPLLQNIASSSSPLSPMEKEYYEKHPEQLKELEEGNFNDSLNAGEKDLDTILNGIDNSNYAFDDESDVITGDFTNATSAQAVLVDDEMDWLNDDQVNDAQNQLQRFAPQDQAEDDTDRFTQDLLRQVEDLPGQHSDVVASEDPLEESNWEPSPRANEAAVGTAAAIGAARYGQVSEKNQTHRSTHSTESSRLPIDLTNGKSGAEYTIFRRDQKVQAVKKGVSWSALFFTIPYLIYRQMFGTAIVYTLMSLIVAAGLIFMGLNWIDAGDSASDLTKLATLGFGLLAVIGILYIPFRHGNNWRSEKLERRGFELVARVKAGNPGKAIALARRASALD